MSNSKRKCAYCKERKKVETMFIRGAQAFCDKEHYIEYQVASKDRLVSKGRKIQRTELNKRKQKLKSINEYASEAQSAVNSYIRARDHKKPCISCGCDKVSVYGGYRGAGGWDAGHYRSRGAAAHLRFNLLNIHKQCVKCNRDKSGNVVDYRINLIKRIGVDLVEKLESDNEPKKFDVDYLNRVKRIFNKRSRWYKKRRGM
ncbi:hypothetical protein phiV208_57 [Vibrio phage phiV208]|nr:hypothetical protein phiV208_57 [Vibrio phage phiV208]